MSAATPSVALVGVPGSCGTGGGRLLLTTDGGRGWKPVKAPIDVVMRVSVTSASSFWVVGSRVDCVPALYQTADGGASWQRLAEPGPRWFIVSAVAGWPQVHTPSGTRAQPCAGSAPQLLAPAGIDAAVVVCSDGRTLATRNGGQSWSAGGSVPQAAAVTMPIGQIAVLLAVDDSCPRGQLATLAAEVPGLRWRSKGCVPAIPDGAALGISSSDSDHVIAVALSGGTVAAWRSSDGGTRWTGAAAS